MSNLSPHAAASLYSVEQLSGIGRTKAGIAASKGNIDEFDDLVELHGESATAHDSYLDTPLHLAATFGHLPLVKVLVKDYRVPVNEVDWEGFTPLCRAVSRGHLDVVKFLLRHGADGKYSTPRGWQLIHIATWYNQLEMTQWLLQHGAPASSKTTHGARPFDVTRPGSVRHEVYRAMLEEQE
mmetsp:Transcript_20625/g.45164  ORF Transcript_20625/g.45164 Transcript_20625/m.45164 type:complete len:182 (+) Transcript_20625:68-613(+)